MKKHFIDKYGLTGYSIIYLCVIGITLLCFGINKYERWLCGNYAQVTGFETKYINWDSCYIKGSDNVFIRYDEKYKSVE